MKATSMSRSAVHLAMALAAALGQPAEAQVRAAHSADSLSSPLPASCKPAAQRELDLAFTAYRTAAWAAVDDGVGRALYADSGCAMAHWLRALALLGRPETWRQGLPERALPAGRLALDHAREAGLHTPRERDYVDALAALYAEDGADDVNVRIDAFERSLGQIACQHGADTAVGELLVQIRRGSAVARR